MTGLHAHLAALQLADSAFPAGLYALSYGLEAYVEAGLVTDAAGVEVFARDLVERHVAPTDGIAAAWAWRAWAAVDGAALRAVDRRLDAAKTVAAQRRSSTAAGRRVADVARATGVAVPEDVHHHAVVMAVLAQARGVGLAQTVAGELYAVASCVLGAGLRLVRMSHLEAQAALHRLGPLLAELTGACLDTPLDDLGAWTPALDAFACAHESASRKLFVT